MVTVTEVPWKVPLPSWPLELLPQERREPARMARECSPPTWIHWMLSSRWTGVVSFFPVAGESWP